MSKIDRTEKTGLRLDIKIQKLIFFIVTVWLQHHLECRKNKNAI